VPRGPRAAARANPAGLTARELDVLALLVDGCSDADIAARLVLSDRTVSHHVSAVLRKLDVPSRARAAAVGRALLAASTEIGQSAGQPKMGRIAHVEQVHDAVS
jgi:DNA-binding NarL/FixJ family response regulator